VLREQLVSIFSAYVIVTIDAEDRHLRTCHIEEILGGFIQVMHCVTLSGLSDTTTLENTILLSRLASIISRMDDQISLLKPETTRILSYSAKCYVSHFTPSDWWVISRRAPVFAAAFKALVHKLRQYDSVVGNTTFHSIKGIQYTLQWNKIVLEILSDRNTPPTTNEATPHVVLDVQPSDDTFCNQATSIDPFSLSTSRPAIIESSETVKNQETQVSPLYTTQPYSLGFAL